jgi:hypothetical protein
MDRTTQQNAALVEESAAAAESLSNQARLLVQSTSAFKLRGDVQARLAPRREFASAHATAHIAVARTVETRGQFAA